jgi:hypothetical protein
MKKDKKNGGSRGKNMKNALRRRHGYVKNTKNAVSNGSLVDKVIFISALCAFIFLLGWHIGSPFPLQKETGCPGISTWTNTTFIFMWEYEGSKIPVYTGVPNCPLYGAADSGLFPSDSKIFIFENLSKDMFEKTLKHEQCHQMVFRGLKVPSGMTEEAFCILESERQ